MPALVEASVARAGLVLAIAAAGCASSGPAPEPPAGSPSSRVVPRCASPLEPYVKVTLYMGRGSRDPVEWQEFVDDVLVLHFPDGGTMVQTAGWWEGRSGASGDSNSRMLVMLHPLAERDAFAASVQAVIRAIKERFGHRAVLWEEAAVCASI